MRIFISYRRGDTRDLAGRIADRLREANGIQAVFIDVDGIDPGVDFKTKIQSALVQSTACLILIGDAWRGMRGTNETPRIFEAHDMVRLEAATALASNLRVLPVLANGARMPTVAELPEDLRCLPTLNALSIRHEYFEHDMDYVIKTLRGERTGGKSSSVKTRVLRSIAGAGAALLLLFLGAVLHNAITDKSLEQSLGGPGEVWMLLAFTLACGAVAAHFIHSPGQWLRPRSSRPQQH